jgi:DNA polymerase
MPTVYWDAETYSQCDLNARGANIYACDATTEIHFFCFAVDDAEVETWKPGDPVPAPFGDPAGYMFVSDNWEFERAIHAHILIKRYGFAALALENQDCAQRLALASAFPAELGLRCQALGLPYRKNPEARKAMRRLSRPQSANKRKKPADPAARERDLELLHQRCVTDVEATRAAYTSSRLRPPPPQEREQLLLDAMINERGVGANIPFLEAMRALAVEERNAINVRLSELTAGVVTSVFQRDRIVALVNAHGHTMMSLTKRSVAATLAHKPGDFVREILELRQRGAYASVRMAKRLLGHADPSNGRIRGALRIYGGAPGRWSSPGPQLHNLRRNDAEYPVTLVDALIAGDIAELARFGNPLDVAAQLSRAALRAKAGHTFICIDFNAVESRVNSWISQESWKLDHFRGFDATGDKELDLYRVLAHRMLRKNSPVSAISAVERQLGKCAELACGFGGSVGAWRRIAGDDGRGDADVLAIIKQWRNAHPAICKFWRRLARAAHTAIRTGKSILVAPAPQPPIVAAFDDYALTLTLPSGRAINYPGAHLVPNGKYEDGDPDIEFFDNARGQWKPVRAWFGVLVENVVQGCARDLLAAALLRFEARGLPVVFHCHDEVVLEVPEGSISEQDVLALLLEPPAWAAGLPLGGKVHSGPLYLEAPATGEPPPPQEEEIAERAVDAFVANAERLPDTKEIEQGAEEDFLASLGTGTAPLTDLVSLPMDASGHVSCPFHDDPQPSCKIYPDHFHCFGCGQRGDRMDWLTRVEGMTKAEAMAALQDWSGPTTLQQKQTDEEKLDFALGIWNAAQPFTSTIGERYLAETRAIDVGKLPLTIHDALRFHPNCVFGAGARHPCIVALMRDPLTDAPVGIHRIGLAPMNGAVTKLDRMALGRMGVVKLWPQNGSDLLVVGEGIETVLAAATRIPYRGTPLTPAWSAVAKDGLARLPVLPSVVRLIQLVDHDENGEGQRAAELGQHIWKSTGRTVVPLIPKQRGWDFNDVVLGRKA